MINKFNYQNNYIIREKKLEKLAIRGGKPIRKKLFPSQNTMSFEEINAAKKVIQSGVLSGFLGTWGDAFYGGPKVQQFEKMFAKMHDSKFGVSVNSCTSGLMAAVGAVGCGPGDEVIVPALTMSATATSALVFNSIPVFADVDPNTSSIDPYSVEKLISKRTKAIMVVHWFGRPVDMDSIIKIAKKNNVFIIEDCAQSPLATYKDKKVGTLGDIGVFSLNYHKHIHTGEGGIALTNSNYLAERMQLIRNHGEAVVASKPTKDFDNLIGFNFRLGEIEAAIGIEQLKKASKLIAKRIENVKYIEKKLENCKLVKTISIPNHIKHVYYNHNLMFQENNEFNLSASQFIDAVKSELPATKLREKDGPLIGLGGIKPLYHLPIYQKQIAIGSKGYPFKGSHYKGKVDYSKALCPNAENIRSKLIIHELMYPNMTKNDLDDFVNAFIKVETYADQLVDVKKKV